MLTVLMLLGFVGAVLAILGLTPRLESWATAPASSALDSDEDALEGTVRP
jgi:hypothetical protein